MRERDRQDELDRARRIGLRIDELTRDYASACEASSEIEHFLRSFAADHEADVKGTPPAPATRMPASRRA